MTEKEALELMRLSGQVATYVSFLPLLLALLKIRVFFKKPYLFLLVYFIIGALLNWATSAFVEYATLHYEEIKEFLTKWEIDDTFFVDPFYFLRNVIFLGAFTYFSITIARIKKWIKYISVFLFVFIIGNAFWGETYKVYQVWGSLLDNIYKLFLGIAILYWLFQANMNRTLAKIPHYWFAMAIIVIGAISGLIDALSNAMFTQTSVIFYQIHTIKNGFMILAFLLFSYGVYLVYHPK